MEKPKLYVGCSLSSAPADFIDEVANFKRALVSEDYDILQFVGKVGGTNKSVYEWDINNCVRRCDAMVAICDLPSIGLGWEMAVAIERKVPILAIAENNANVSRLVLGAAEVEVTIQFQWYDKLEQMVPIVHEMVQGLVPRP